MTDRFAETVIASLEAVATVTLFGAVSFFALFVL